MLNPWVLLGLLLFWLSSMAGAYIKGSQNAQDAARAIYAQNLESAIKDAEEARIVDMEAAREAGERDAKARARFQTVRGAANEAIRAQPLAASCDWGKPAFDGLLNAILAANSADSKDTTASLSDAIRKANAPGK